MNKFIHIKMDSYINNDALKIHEYNENISITEIKNTLSKIIGWNSFIELEKSVININTKGVLNFLKLCDKNISNIEDLSSNELDRFKMKYYENIKKSFPYPEKHYFEGFDGKKHEPYDLYKITNGLIYNYEKTINSVVKKGSGEVIEISTLSNDTLIELDNNCFRNILHFLLDLVHSNHDASSMWKGRTAVYLNLILNILEYNNEHKWQLEFSKYFSFESIVKEWIDCKDENFKEKIYSIIVNMPTFPTDGNFFDENNAFGRLKTEELYYWMIMTFSMFNKPICFNLKDNVKNIYNLNDLKKSDKTIVLKHYENEDNNNIVQILKIFLDSDPNAMNNYFINLLNKE